MMNRFQAFLDVNQRPYNLYNAENIWTSNHGRGLLTLVHFSAQPKSFWSHLHVSPCLIDWGKVMHPTYPTKCAYFEPKSGRV